MSQEELISRQMIGIMTNRLESLTEIAAKRKSALACDLTGDVLGSTKTLPQLQDPYKIPATLRNKLRQSTSSPLIHDDMMERLFGAEDTRMKPHHESEKMKLEMQKHEMRRNARVQLENHLQASMEGYVTRTVESYPYAINAQEIIEFDASLFLRYVFKRLVLRKKKKAFHHFLTSELSCKLFESIFWLCFCHFFQRDSKKDQFQLGQKISSYYVRIFDVLHSEMDEIFLTYPYAIASGVCWGLHYLFPGSRQLYTFELKDRIYQFVCRVLLGYELSPISIELARKQLFPDERIEAIGRKQAPPMMNKGSSSELAVANTVAAAKAMDDVMLLSRSSGSKATLRPSTQVGSTRLGHSKSETSFFRPCVNDPSIEEIIAVPKNKSMGGLRASTAKQNRALFNASQLSSLVRNYLDQPNKTVRKSCYLTRTTVSERRENARSERMQMHSNLADPTSSRACLKDIKKMKRQAKHDISALEESRDKILKSGQVAIKAHSARLVARDRNVEAPSSKIVREFLLDSCLES